MDKQDIRILALYKQHYLDKYRSSLIECDYSCLGYYDGISVCEASENKSGLFEKKSNSPISPIWYGMGDSIGELNGNYSKQNIGIFRPVDDNENPVPEFWGSVYEHSPYFAVGFIRLDNLNNYAYVAEAIEKKGKSFIQDNGLVKTKYVRNIVYHTFDNAHLIVFVKTNSMLKLGEMIQEIKEIPEVKYIHSIIGVLNDYLKECGKDEVLPLYRNIDCHIGEALACISHKVVTSGNKETINHVLYILEKQKNSSKLGLKNFEKITYSHVTGHEDLIINIPQTDVKSLLAMLIEEGFSTHKNRLYETEIYNIETDIVFRENGLCLLDKKDLDNRDELVGMQSIQKKSWCEMLIEKCKEEMRETFNSGDESLYSCYRALTQTLNTLAQYERFSLSKDLFYLLFPSFAMFYEHLEKINTQESKVINKEVLCEFVSAINSIIYHTVHTDQVFLMVPGYTGTSYSIPIKNCLLYLGVVNRVIEVLNDCQNEKYACLLTPEMEAHPSTTLLNIGATKRDRLIRFFASQRSLYVPRHFIVILTHEIAHYVGKDIRSRQERVEFIFSSIAYLIAEAILPGVAPDNVNRELYCIFLSGLKNKVNEKCKQFLSDNFKKEPDERKYHSVELEKFLKEKCQDFLVSDQDGVEECIYEIPEIVFTSGNLLSDAKHISIEVGIIQNRMIYHRNMLLSLVQTMITELILIYKEVFSDVAATCILGCDYKTFEEAFDVSEGVKLKEETEDISHKVRKLMIGILLDKKENIFEMPDAENESQKSELIDEKLDKDWPISIKDELYSYHHIGEKLYEYARLCKGKIENRIEKCNILKNIRWEIRDIYGLFVKDEKPCFTVYRDIIYYIDQYIQVVEKNYQEIKNEIEKKETE